MIFVGHLAIIITNTCDNKSKVLL